VFLFEKQKYISPQVTPVVQKNSSVFEKTVFNSIYKLVIGIFVTFPVVFHLVQLQYYNNYKHSKNKNLNKFIIKEN